MNSNEALYNDKRNKKRTLWLWNTEIAQRVFLLLTFALMLYGISQPSSVEAQEGVTLTGHMDEVRSIVFSPDSKTLTSASVDGTVKLWDVESGDLLDTPLSQDDMGGYDVVLSPDGKTFAAARGAYVVMWDVETSKQLPISPLSMEDNPYDNWASRIAFSLDGDTFVAIIGNNINLWDMANGKSIVVLPPDADEAFELKVSPNGNTVAFLGAFRGLANVWDVVSSNLLISNDSSEVNFSRVAFSPDGKIFATIDSNQIDLRDVANGNILTTLSGSYSTVAFSPDGRNLAAQNYDNDIELLDVTSGDILATINGLSNWAPILEFSPDGKTLAAVSGFSEDPIITLWDIDLQTAE